MMEFLLGKNLGRKDIPKIDLLEIVDFPRLKKQDIRKNITLGTFKLKQARSYLEDLVNNYRAYTVFPSSSFVKNIANKIISHNIKTKSEKIIAAEIISRHKRSKLKNEKHLENESDVNFKYSNVYRNTYKVFVMYKPNINTSKGITGSYFIY